MSGCCYALAIFFGTLAAPYDDLILDAAPQPIALAIKGFKCTDEFTGMGEKTLTWKNNTIRAYTSSKPGVSSPYGCQYTPDPVKAANEQSWHILNIGRLMFGFFGWCTKSLMSSGIRDDDDGRSFNKRRR